MRDSCIGCIEAVISARPSFVNHALHVSAERYRAIQKRLTIVTIHDVTIHDVIVNEMHVLILVST